MRLTIHSFPHISHHLVTNWWFLINCLSSIINYQSSTINHQLSIINYLSLTTLEFVSSLASLVVCLTSTLFDTLRSLLEFFDREQNELKSKRDAVAALLELLPLAPELSFALEFSLAPELSLPLALMALRTFEAFEFDSWFFPALLCSGLLSWFFGFMRIQFGWLVLVVGRELLRCWPWLRSLPFGSVGKSGPPASACWTWSLMSCSRATGVRNSLGRHFSRNGTQVEMYANRFTQFGSPCPHSVWWWKQSNDSQR